MISVLIFINPLGFQCIIDFNWLISSPTIQIVSFLFGILLVFFLYLAVYLPYIKHDTREWNLICPVELFFDQWGIECIVWNVIWNDSICNLVFYDFCILSSALCCFWKIWGFLTPFIFLLFIFTLVDFLSHFYPVF